jgi:hypothetical protein
MIMFNTMGDEQFRTTGMNTMPRLLDTTDDRVKFIAAVRSPVARDILNFDVRLYSITNLYIGRNQQDEHDYEI